MTYKDDVFNQNIEEAIDPIKSPLTPAHYIRQELETNKKLVPVKENKYSTKLPEIEKFIDALKIAHSATMAAVGQSTQANYQLKGKLDQLKDQVARSLEPSPR